MAIDPDVQRVVDKIDKRIESLQRIKQTLLREFVIDSSVEQFDKQRALEAAHIKNTIEKIKVSGRDGMKRKESMIAYLKHNGPSTRAEIINNLGIPRGTAGFYLTDKDTFVKTQDDKWTVKQGH